ncbi:DUF2023 family protein [Methanolobus profundi]|uniref:DUF2023 domain-containing protein n=1 Tax=Methanolobus profundi TaxID=487685 RepID=A0A1I4S4T9_9EURY|nr:DUF2023 family protein [Methanolobus profundi]SFM59273.1 Protein of unknown function [Methanolobus profundi]
MNDLKNKATVQLNEVTEEMLKTYLHGSMQILRHHIYEYQKGIRDLILHTASAFLEDEIIDVLERKKVNYLVQKASEKKINVFFGDEKCISILKNIGDKSLSDYTDEEDFILGIMLGYDRVQQCDRYLKRKSRNSMADMFL